MLYLLKSSAWNFDLGHRLYPAGDLDLVWVDFEPPENIKSQIKYVLLLMFFGMGLFTNYVKKQMVLCADHKLCQHFYRKIGDFIYEGS